MVPHGALFEDLPHALVAGNAVGHYLHELALAVHLREILVVVLPLSLGPVQERLVHPEGVEHPVGVVVPLQGVDDGEGQGDDVVLTVGIDAALNRGLDKCLDAVLRGGGIVHGGLQGCIACGRGIYGIRQ